MVLSIALSNSSFEVAHQCMSVNIRSFEPELLSKQVHKILHKITLAHQKVLSDRIAVTFELELLEKDFDKRRVSNFIRIVNPIIKLRKSIRSRSREALGIKRKLQ